MTSSGSRLHWLPSVLLGAMFFFMAWGNLHKSLSYDEPNNLRYGYKFLTEGPMAEPEGQRMPVLALNALGCVSYGCDWEVLDSREMSRLIVRLPSMIFALLAGWVLYIWVMQAFGRIPALLSLGLYVFNPNFIAHGKQLTSDMAVTFFVLAWMFCLWKLSRTQKRRWFFLASLSAGGALLSKFSAVLILPVSALVMVPDFWKAWKEEKGATAVKWAGAAALFGLLVIFYVNAGYLFKGSFTPGSQYKWQSRSYQKLQHCNLPIPFPKIFMQGVDYTKYLEENPQIGRGNNYILGRTRRKGRWYAYPIMIGLKTPLALFLLIFLAFRRRAAKAQGLNLFLWLPFGVWVFVFSVFSEAQLGIRYLLPVLTFPIIFAAREFAGPMSGRKFKTLCVLLGWYAFSSLSYMPHSMSYFNEIIGPRVNAWRYLADSNLDWEDKNYFLRKFRDENKDKILHYRPRQARPGYILIGANDLTGVMDEKRFEWLRKNFNPIQHVTYSHYLFYVPKQKFREIFPSGPPPPVT